jgi:hypothetical protein
VDRVLRTLDRFLARVLAAWRGGRRLLVLASDHGNIEDLSTRTHTRNPVPLVAVGRGAARLSRRVRALDDFAPALLALYPPRDRPAGRAHLERCAHPPASRPEDSAGVARRDARP